nr:MAG TPA: hypothetical protein [Caudoviricetes sp.]
MSKTIVAYSVRCRSCIFANTISRRDMDIHLFCPFAGCIYTGGEKDEDKTDQIQERRRTD